MRMLERDTTAIFLAFPVSTSLKAANNFVLFQNLLDFRYGVPAPALQMGRS